MISSLRRYSLYRDRWRETDKCTVSQIKNKLKQDENYVPIPGYQADSDAMFLVFS